MPQLVEYEPGKPFSWFPKKVANARREADKDPLKRWIKILFGSPQKYKIYT